MPSQITDEIIDAIIQNEGRHLGRSGKSHPPVRTLLATRNLACLKPDWTQLPPGWAEEGRPDPDPTAKRGNGAALPGGLVRR